MLKKIFSLIIALFVLLMTTGVFASDGQNIKSAPLPAIKILGSYTSPLENDINYITPSDGVDLESARNLIKTYFKNNGSSVSTIKTSIKEITTKEFWDNNKAQLYCDNDEYNDRTYFAVIKDNIVTNIVTGPGFTCIDSIYIADINNDNKYDVCSVMSVGSGWIDARIEVLDLENQLEYEMEERFSANFDLSINDSDLLVIRNGKTTGRLTILDGVLASSGYFYEIGDIKAVSESGEKLTSINRGNDFIVDVEINKIAERNERDYLFIAVYEKNGKLLSLDYLKTNIANGNSLSLGFYIPQQPEAIGSIKAYVWNNFNSAKPLAESKTLSF